MFFVEKKEKKDKRYESIAFASEDIKECENFIKNELKNENKLVYRIKDTITGLKSKPYHKK